MGTVSSAADESPKQSMSLNGVKRTVRDSFTL